MVQFMDIACGDYKMLGGDKVKAAELIGAFHRISDPAGYQVILQEKIEDARRKARILLFSVMLTLLSLDAEDDVRKLLEDIGKTRASRMEPEKMRMMVEQFLRSERAAQERAEKERVKDEQPDARKLRADFYTEVTHAPGLECSRDRIPGQARPDVWSEAAVRLSAKAHWQPSPVRLRLRDNAPASICLS